jgi:hypothetical protein
MPQPQNNAEPPIDMKADIKLSEDGVSYVRDGTPFEFKYSCMETRKVKPLKLREEKLKEIDFVLFCLPG